MTRAAERRRWVGATIALAVAAVGAVGAVGVRRAIPPPPQSRPTRAQPVVSVVAAPADGFARRAAASVSAMPLREKAAAVVMGHIPTTDTAALRDYMQRTGIGGFLLMGANIPPAKPRCAASPRG